MNTVPCATCGAVQVEQKGLRCTNCWEVENRLDHYLRSAKGLREVLRAVHRALKEDE